MSPMRLRSHFMNLGAKEPLRFESRYLPRIRREDTMRSILLWAIGIPLPIIIILWLVSGHA